MTLTHKLIGLDAAGGVLGGVTKDTLLNPITLGSTLGLFIGQQMCFFGICWLVIKCKLAKLPKGATWLQFYGVALLCGVGFSMSLFIGTLAFEVHGLTHQANVKIGVSIGFIISAILGEAIIAFAQPKTRHTLPK